MASREAATPKLAPSSMQMGSSIIENKFLWGGLIVGSLAFFFGALIYLCKKKRVIANCMRRRPKQKG